MEDNAIIGLYWNRSEQAIQETDQKYGGYCYTIAENILNCQQDSEETVSDTYMAAWKTIPPQKPLSLKTFLGRIARNLSIDRWRSQNRLKRGGGEIVLALQELSECVEGSPSAETCLDEKELHRAIYRFINELQGLEQKVFMCRYWYLEPIDTIAERFGCSKGKVTTMLYRTRKKLKAMLREEGYL